MALCLICYQTKKDEDMLVDKSRSDGIATTCADCKAGVRRNAEKRKKIYREALARIAARADINLPIKELLRLIEREILEDAIMASDGVVCETSRLLGSKRSGISMKLASHGISNKITNEIAPHLDKFKSISTGVSWHAPKSKWRASIIIDNDKIILGLFKTQRQATEMYQIAKANKGSYNKDKEEFAAFILRTWETEHL